jgi:hypothetical protein
MAWRAQAASASKAAGSRKNQVSGTTTASISSCNSVGEERTRSQ